MSLSARRKQAEQERERLQQIKIDRAKRSADAIIASDQFKMSAIATPEAKLCLNGLLEGIMGESVKPENDFVDVLHAKGFRNAEIRKLVFKLYNTYCVGIDSDVTKNDVLYEDMLPKVAEYVMSHQELYNTFTVEDMRRSDS